MSNDHDDSTNFEEEEDDSSFSYLPTTTGTLFVVDISDVAMLSPLGDTGSGDTPASVTLRAIRDVYCNKLISGTKDHCGVVLVGTNTSVSGYHGHHTLIPLDTPDKGDIEVLEKVISSTELHGAKCDYSPYQLLWICSSTFTSCTKKLSARRVMLFTNVSEPRGLDPKTRDLAVTKARDMAELGITISLFPLPGPHSFQLDRYYSSILADSQVAGDVITGDLEELSQRIHQRDSNVRVTRSIDLVLSPELKVGVTCSALVGNPSTPRHVNLCSKTNLPVLCTSSVVREADRAVLLPHDIHRTCRLGGDDVIFSKDEVDRMKVETVKGIYVIGFKPASSLKLHHVAGKSLFIRPSEEVWSGGSVFFKSLLARLTARGLVAMCHCVPREGTAGYIGALVPQADPPGFNLLKLPFAEDIRKLNYDPTNPPNAAQVEAAKAVVLKLKARYNSGLIENPESLTFNKTLEAIALERDSIEDTQDRTQPDVGSIDTRAGGLMSQLGKSIGGFTIPEECKKPDYKKVITLVQNKQREGNINKVSVADLRLYCKGVRLKVAANAKKADLVEAVKKFLG